MHFGKRLLLFEAPEGSRVLDYKALKKLIKSGNFSEFPGALVAEGLAVRESLMQQISRLELLGASIQKGMLLNGSIFSPEQVSFLLKKLKLSKLPHVTTDSFVNSVAKRVDYSEDVTPLKMELNAFLQYADICACGVRKIAKKFRKRSGITENAELPVLVEPARVKRIIAVTEGLCSIAKVPPPQSPGSEISSLIA